MAKAVKCDRCGRLFEYYDVKAWNSELTNVLGFHTVVQGSYNSKDGYYYKKTYDLCIDCCKEFNKWLEESNET